MRRVPAAGTVSSCHRTSWANELDELPVVPGTDPVDNTLRRANARTPRIIDECVGNIDSQGIVEYRR